MELELLLLLGREADDDEDLLPQPEDELDDDEGFDAVDDDDLLDEPLDQLDPDEDDEEGFDVAPQPVLPVWPLFCADDEHELPNQVEDPLLDDEGDKGLEVMLHPEGFFVVAEADEPLIPPEPQPDREEVLPILLFEEVVGVTLLTIPLLPQPLLGFAVVGVP